MDRISQLIPKVLSKKGLKDQAQASYTVYSCREWIYEHLPSVAQQLHPKKISDGVLTVHSDHSIASQELSQAKEELLEYLRGLDGVTVTDLHIHLSGHSN